jgi:hypothetical protein
MATIPLSLLLLQARNAAERGIVHYKKMPLLFYFLAYRSHKKNFSIAYRFRFLSLWTKKRLPQWKDSFPPFL